MDTEQLKIISELIGSQTWTPGYPWFYTVMYTKEGKQTFLGTDDLKEAINFKSPWTQVDIDLGVHGNKTIVNINYRRESVLVKLDPESRRGPYLNYWVTVIDVAKAAGDIIYEGNKFKTMKEAIEFLREEIVKKYFFPFD